MKPSNNKKPWRDEETLRRLYHDEQMSMQDIADHFGGLTFGGIKYWMDKHEIERRSRSDSAKVRWLKEIPRMNTHISGYEKWSDQSNNVHHPVYVHRLLAVAEFGFDAVKDKVVHHKNEIPWDNRVDNIELMTAAEHATLHHTVD